MCNHIFPTELTDGYFDQWTAAQQQNLQFVEEAFQPLPIFRVPMFGQEVMGEAMLRLTAATVFGEVAERGRAGDPTQTFYNGQPQKVYQQDGQYLLSLALPMVSKEEVKLHRSVVDKLMATLAIGNATSVCPSAWPVWRLLGPNMRGIG